MKTSDLKEDLLEELRDPQFAVAYLRDALDEGDMKGFVLALRDLAEALGGVGKIAKGMNTHRVGVYKALSKNGNPLFSTVLEAMSAMGLGLCPIVKDADVFRERGAEASGDPSRGAVSM